MPKHTTDAVCGTAKFIYFEVESFSNEVNAQHTLFLPPSSQCLLVHSRSLKYELARVL